MMIISTRWKAAAFSSCGRPIAGSTSSACCVDRKDSNVLVWLARSFSRACAGPVIHVDTSYKLPEMIAVPTTGWPRNGGST